MAEGKPKRIHRLTEEAQRHILEAAEAENLISVYVSSAATI